MKRKRIVSLILVLTMVLTTVLSNITVFADEETVDDYDRLREKWQYLAKGGDYNPEDPNMQGLLRSINDVAQDLLDRMNQSPTPGWGSNDYLWAEYILGKRSDAYADSNNTQFTIRSLKFMALAYQTKGCDLYQNEKLKNEILRGLDYIYKNHYKIGVDSNPYGNWFTWEIGGPIYLLETVLLMSDYMPADQIQAYAATALKATTKTGGDSYMYVGANALWRDRVRMYAGILLKDGETLNYVKNDVPTYMGYVTSGDGYYADGTFMQHGTVVYNGGYGKEAFSDISHFIYMLDGSPWEIKGTERDNMPTIVEKSYVPFMYKGIFMDMVRGREITRTDTTDAYAGITISLDVLLFSESLPEQEGRRFKGMIKEWMNNENAILTLNEGAGVAWYLFPVYNLSKTLEIINDDSITPVSNVEKSYTFGKGVRTVHTNDKFTFGLSMYSKDIKTYEVGDSNQKGWYTGLGQTYVYTPDIGQFTLQKPTLNWYRLSGVTAVNGITVGSHTNASAFAGSTTLKSLYSTAGLEISSGSTQVSAKKSWFMFDDEIVALGTDISSNHNNKVETTIDNHYITKDNDFIVDGEKQSNELGWNSSFDDVTWALIEGNVKGSNIGVYFPNKARIGAVRETRTGKWTDLGSYNVDETIQTANYLTTWIDHGAKPVDDGYAYVLLPGTNAAQVENYADSSDIYIVRQDTNVHAVYEKTLHTLGANFWKNEYESIDAMGVENYLSVDKASSIMIKEDDDKLSFALTDTTQRNTDSIMVEINREAAGVISKDNRIKVIQTSPSIRLQIDVDKSVGNPIEAEFSFKALDLPGETAITGMFLSDDTLSVNFKEAMRASGYKLVYGTVSGEYTDSLVTSGTTAEIRGLNANTTYYFAVQAINDSGEGELSAERSYVIGNTRTLIDEFADFSKTVSYSGGWATDSSNAGTYYNGDDTRIKRNDADKTNPRRAEYITYYAPSPVDFELTTYDYGVSASDNTILEIYGSPDNENWTLIPATATGPAVTKDKWSKLVYTNAGDLDHSIKFIKIVVSNNTKIWAPQLSKLVINYAWASDRVVMDTMLDDSRAYEINGDAAYMLGDGVKFGGDKDILIKSGSDDATLLYSYTNIQDAKLTAYISKENAGNVSFQSSADGSDFKNISSNQVNVAGDYGDYNKVVYNIPNLDVGTNYLLLTVSGEADSIALSDIKLSYVHEIAPIQKIRFRDHQLEAVLNYTLLPAVKLAPMNATGEISYTISNKNIASVNTLTGALQAQDLGTAVLKATVLGTEKDISESINVRTSQNVALKAGTTASSERSGYAPSKAVDGDYLSRWESNAGATQWLQIDFGSPKEFNVIELNWQQYATNYVVQGSQNGSVWETLYTETKGKGGNVWVELDSAKKYRFIKLSGTQAPAAYSLYELRVLSFKSQSIVLGNLAIGKTATTSGNDTTNSNPLAAIDGSTSTRWASARAEGQWYTIDLGTRCNIYQINLMWEASYGKEYDIQVYDDEANITTAVMERSGAEGWKKYVLNEPVQGRYVRMKGILRGNTKYGYSIYEFEVMGNLVETDVNSIQFASEKLSVLRGNKKTASVITDPPYLNDGSIIFESSNPEIATVSDKGIITGISTGTTVITARSAIHEEVSDSCEVTVTDYNGAPIPVSNLEVQGNASILEKGTTAQLDASIAPDNASIKNIRWTSSDESVLLVTNEGLIKAIGVGSAVVKGTSVANPHFLYEREIRVVDAEAETVKALIHGIGIVTLDSKEDIDTARAAFDALTDEQKALVDNYADLEAAEARYEALVEAIQTVRELIDAIGIVTLYSKDDIDAARAAYNALTEEQKALVDNDEVLEAAEVEYEALLLAQTVETVKELINSIGEVTLSSKTDINVARAAYNALTEEQKALVDNYADLEAAEARYQELEASEKVSSIKLDKATMALKVGAHGQLIAEITPATAVNKDVTWSSSNTSIATVDSTGLVTAKATGTANITATTLDGGKTATCLVTVSKRSGSTKPTTPVTQTPTENVSDVVPVSETVMNSTGKASTAIDENALTKALTTADKAKINVPKAEGASAYEIVVPATVLMSDAAKKIDIATELGRVSVPGNMLDTANAAGANNVGLTIAKTDRDMFGSAVRSQIGERPAIALNVSINGKETTWSNPQAPVTVGIPYTPTAGELANPEHIVIWYVDEEGKAVPVPTGKYDSETGTVTFTTTHSGNYAVAYVVKSFGDIGGYPWSSKEIEVMAAKGVINGTSETTFHPSADIKRADFMVMLVKALGLTAKPQGNFSDVSPSAYYAEALATARALGITTGVGNNKFDPNAKISREDMMVLSARAMNMAGRSLGTASDAEMKGYSDSSQISGYALKDVAALIEAGVIKGSGNSINPKKTATRAETAVIIYNLYNR
ncbi:polysaccharide lyase family 8 super-sandwich domain-containing protein [Anoxybacterium hadale]|uniref:polysaccharide lyase family 8 super-sandwich domain-containing protein n=1 Tax=Anoxybacterium hadale TaxID=3408580 RepID=UPI003B002DAA